MKNYDTMNSSTILHKGDHYGKR